MLPNLESELAFFERLFPNNAQELLARMLWKFDSDVRKKKRFQEKIFLKQ